MKIIDSYLVSLGFTVDQPQLRKFEDALRSLAVYVERYTTNQYTGIASMFLKTGAAIGGTIAGLEAGFLGLATRTANSDLQMQIMARRMFMSASAFREMKVATDALGVSLEDVMFGPPELRERYAQLMGDQKRWGFADESSLRNIRDIEQSFTRLKMAFEWGFLPKLAGDIGKAFAGKDFDIGKWLDALDDKKLQHYADVVSGALVPALQTTYDLLKAIPGFVSDLYQGLKATWAEAKSVIDYIKPYLGSPSDNELPTAGGDPSVPAGKDRSPSTSGTAMYQSAARFIAQEYGIDPNLFMGLIKRESEWNPNARNPSSGAYGYGQLMPGNMGAFGLSGKDPGENLIIAARLFAQYLKEANGDTFRALESYNGLKSFNDPDKMRAFKKYYSDIQGNANEYRREWGDAPGGAKLGPTAFHSTIQIHVDKTSASAQDIAAAVKPVVHEELALMSQRLLTEYGGVYAS